MHLYSPRTNRLGTACLPVVSFLQQAKQRAQQKQQEELSAAALTPPQQRTQAQVRGSEGWLRHEGGDTDGTATAAMLLLCMVPHPAGYAREQKRRRTYSSQS